MLHALLTRQFKRAGLDPSAPPGDPGAWQSLLGWISHAYTEADQDRYLLERSLAISSEEMRGLHERLATERDTLRTVIGSLQEGLCALDGHGAILFINPKAVAILGLSTAAVLGQPLHGLTDLRDENGRPIRSFSSETATCESRLVVGGDSSAYIVFRTAPLAEPRDGVLITLSDITERRRAATEKEQVEETLRETHVALLNAMPGISRLSADGCYERANDAYAAMLGYDAEELVGVHWERTVHHDDHSLGRHAFQLMRRTGKAEFEALAIRKDGSTFYKQVLMVRIDGPSREPIGHHCFMRDITERRRAEFEREAAQQKLVEMSRRAGMAEVATNVLHNVGNVLNSVNVSATLAADKLRRLALADLLTVTELMKQRSGDLGAFITRDEKGRLLPSFLSELCRHLVQEQRAVLQELESLTTNIGHIKDIVSTQQSYARTSGVVEEVRLTELVETALRFNTTAMERHQVSVVRDYDLDPPVLVDKHRVLQILVNLISNAKYAVDHVAADDRRLTVRIARSPGRPDRIQIAVIDNGVGIPSENLTRIFAHGFTTKKDGHGFGLHGAALAASEMGGALTAHSDGPDRGATFTLELPLNPVEVRP